MSAQLDEQFGRVVTLNPQDPTVMSQAEAQGRTGPSQMVLNSQNAPQLADHMRHVEVSCEPVQYLSDTVRFLWLIDAQGEFRISLEEYVSAGSLNPVSVRPAALPRAVQTDNLHLERLGHPSLAPEFQARIGGELYFDRSDQTWNLSNGSGRFGFARGRTEDHLRNALSVLATFGISAEMDYLPPR